MGAGKTIAKITRPSLSDVVPRERLFRLLDSWMQRPLVWISAGAGSGKTKLVAGHLNDRKLPCLWYRCDEGDADPATFFYYMGLAAKKAAPRRKVHLPLFTPEYLSGAPAFARRYFEKLYACLADLPASPGPLELVIVLDNYQDVPEGSPLHQVIADGLDLLPEGFRAIVISRSEPPPAFARLLAGGKIGLLERGDLRFSLDEARELARGRLPERGEKQLRAMYKTTEGWAAGIILLLERARLKGAETKAPDSADYASVFDYFAGEIFRKTEPEIQDFLLKTSLLPVLDVSLAEKLTGSAQAGRILAALNRRNYFTERLSGKGLEFQYHPLFRSFLQNQLKAAAAPAELASMQRETGRLLERYGWVEEAARLYAEAGEARVLARVVSAHAGEFLRQGRSRTVAEWIAAIPASLADGDPWLLYWSGRCAFPLDIPRAREALNRAMALFRAANDASGISLAWAAAFDTYLYEIGNWQGLEDHMAALEALRRQCPAPPSREADMIVSSKMLMALVLKSTGQRRELERWRAHVSALLAQDPSLDVQMDTAFSMSLYFLWQGDYGRNAVLLEQAAADILQRHVSPLAVIRIRMMQGIHAWISAQYDAALKLLSNGLDMAKKSGVHLFDSLLWSFQTAAQMAGGRLRQAQSSLNRQKESLLATGNALDLFFYHINCAWQALLQDKAPLAAGYMEAIEPQVERIGTPYYRALWHIGMAQARFGQGREEEAGRHVAAVRRIGREMQSQVIEWYGLIVNAWFLLLRGREKEGLEALARGFLLGRRHGYVHLEFYRPALMQLLCARALERNIEPEYARELIRKLNLAPPPGALHPEDWPCPLVVRTLGTFTILKNGEPLTCGGKMQKKPLDLLKALIAAGGVNVPARRLADELWPDATGDKAGKSFETTLARLRRLLGANRVLQYGGGQLSLDPASCCVDSLALEEIFNELRATPADQAGPLWDRASALYRGPFLPAESLSWAMRRRETLRDGMLRCIAAAGRRQEQAEAWEQALAWWMRGLEADDLVEYFYQRVMACHMKLGNNSEVARAYTLCRRKLRDQLGIAPSAATETLYSSILQSR
ncbi:BTAD domain-containing putative transcriptional regulator [Desulfovibrio aminophilus]|uniref:BTAD domain-containing putative transcriptional regulator n=1 Tax=Desulfovibrio aminophilus TaxID=81425 RepID=UPI003391B7CC